MNYSLIINLDNAKKLKYQAMTYLKGKCIKISKFSKFTFLNFMVRK